MELFWSRVEAKLPLPERAEARWIVGESLIERNEISYNQIRSISELLAETGTKKSLVLTDIAKFESSIKALAAAFQQKAEKTNLPLAKLLPRMTERETRIWESITSGEATALVFDGPRRKAELEEAILKSPRLDLMLIEDREKELRAILDAENDVLAEEAERLQGLLSDRFDLPKYYLDLQSLQKKLEKEERSEIPVVLTTPVLKRGAQPISASSQLSRGSARPVPDLDFEEESVAAYDSGNAIELRVGRLMQQLYPDRPSSNSSGEYATTGAMSSEEEDFSSRPTSKASKKLRRIVELHRDAPDLSWHRV